MSNKKRSESNRERLERLRNPDKYRGETDATSAGDTPSDRHVRPGTLEEKLTRRPPLINKRRIQLQRLDRPPRSISPALWLRTVLGGWLQQFGWLFLGFGMIFFWGFGMQADIGWPLLAGETAIAEARVTGYRETNASEGGSDSSPGTPIYATQYEFTANGHSYQGESFATGSYRRSGERREVEYSTGNPARSRLVGMRSKMFGAAAIFVVIFPALGLGFVLFGMRFGLKAAKLLRIGLVAYGRLVSKQTTNTTINDQPVYNLTYEFKTRSGVSMRASARSHVPEALEDEAEEPLFYDPDDPANAVLLDAVPGEPDIRDNGDLSLGSFTGLLKVLLLPFLTVVGHGCYVAFGLM